MIITTENPTSALEVSSTGTAGEPDFNRSEGRAYFTTNERFTSVQKLLTTYHDFEHEAFHPPLDQPERTARRRSVFRTRCSEMVAQELMTRTDLPLEVCYPLGLIHPGETDFLIMLGKNIHDSEVPEWLNVYDYWKQGDELSTRPMDRVANLQKDFVFTRNLTHDDAESLANIWKPFGWSLSGVTAFIDNISHNSKAWFAGVRNSEGKLVSAAMGEALNFANMTLVEGTEYGTLPEYEGHGLCTANIVTLHAQILQDLLYKQGIIPIITSEFDMSSRSDIVGKKTGMTIPMVDGVAGLEESPIQVLRYNVSVLDRQLPNNLSWRDLGSERHKFKESYRTFHRYWRNFIVGILPSQSINEYYSEEMVNNILEKAYAHFDY